MVVSNDVALVAGELAVVFGRYLSVAFAAGLIGTFSLMQPAHVAELWRPSAAAAPIPDPPPLPLPCNKQSWYNADRICLSWTVPHDFKRQLVGVAASGRNAAAIAIMP